MSWRREARARQAQGRRRFYLLLTALFLAVLVVIGVGALAWTFLLGAPPTPAMLLGALIVLLNAMGAWMYRFGPALPFRGKAPEEVAAEAFRAGRDVRSDDDVMEKDLTL